MGIKGHYRLANMGVKVQTDYDADQEELLQMMLRWLPVYMNDIRLGRYVPPARMEQSLRNIFVAQEHLRTVGRPQLLFRDDSQLWESAGTEQSGCTTGIEGAEPADR